MNNVINKIALVGIGCRFPGNIHSPDDFWNFLRQNGDGIIETPADRWSNDKYFSSDKSAKGKIYTKKGGFVDNIYDFDPQFFSISPKEAAQMDPQQRLLLQATKEALEDAGVPLKNVSGAKAGVYVGLFMHDFENLQNSIESDYFTPQSATAASTTIAANRISYCFNFLGPSMVIDTACSSSLVAIHLACKSLLNSETDICFAGGVNVILIPESTMLLCKAEMLSRDGYCKSFDARADGYARAEGVAILVLKTLEKALHDNDDIYAIIRGGAVNQDGKTPGITVPNPASQINVINNALNDAGIKAGEIGYVEAHGTGTPVGDPAEISAIAAAITKNFPVNKKLFVGSVKSNFGHTESAAGVAGVIKAALILKHGKIPANLHFNTPNPNIPFDKFKIRVPTTLIDFPKNKKFVSVNSFGFGGTNAHIILERFTHSSSKKIKKKNLIIPLSAKNSDSLISLISRFKDFFSKEHNQKLNLFDVGYTMAIRRDHYDYRAAFICKNTDDFLNQLNTFSESDIYKANTASNTAFVFSGMGQQWEKMGKNLFNSQPLFNKIIRDCDDIFYKMPGKWQLIDTLFNKKLNSPIDAQRCVFSLQVALGELLKSKNILPDKVIGHSVGEIAAAYTAGIFSLEDAVKICYHRSRLQQKNAGKGKMLAAAISKKQAEKLCEKFPENVFVAAVNSAKSVTLSGTSSALEKILLHLKNKNIFARMLNVDVPYHTPFMQNIIDELKISLSDIKPKPAKIPLVSTVTAEILNGKEMDAEYWCNNVRQPVNFISALKKLKNFNLFVEIAAHPVLATYISDSLTDKKIIPTMRRGKNSSETFLAAVANLYQTGFNIDWKLFYEKHGNLVKLPKHPLISRRYWYEPEEHYNIRTELSSLAKTGGAKYHFAGEKLSTAMPLWRLKLNNYKLEYLKEHKVENATVFPAAAYIEFALAAMMSVNNKLPLSVSNFKILSPILITDNTDVELAVKGNDFEIYSGDSNDKTNMKWRLNAKGSYDSFFKTKGRKNIKKIINRCKDKIDKNDFYSSLKKSGFDYGFHFRNVDKVFLSHKEKIGFVKINPTFNLNNSVVHPALLDSAFQIAAADSNEKFIPVGIDKLSVFSNIESDFYVWVRTTSKNQKFVKIDISILNLNGKTIVDITGLKCKSLDYEELDDINEYFCDYIWQSQPIDEKNNSAEYLPSPISIKKRTASFLKQICVDYSREIYYGKINPLLDKLAFEYIVNALYELGWQFNEKSFFTAEYLLKKLGVKNKYKKVLKRYLSFLARKHFLKKSNNEFKIIKKPEHKNPVELWQKNFLKFPSYFIDLFIVQVCGAELPDILKGKTNPLDVIFPKTLSIAEHLYKGSYSQIIFNKTIADIIANILKSDKNLHPLNILEVGGGTASLTSEIIREIPPGRCQYYFTDISQSFINSARAKFQKFNFINFGILDIENEPSKQNFNENSFDIILASNVIHATANLSRSINNLKKLLKPGGILIALEVTNPGFWYDVTFGVFQGTRLFSDKEIRKEHALIGTKEWVNVFRKCGFEECEIINETNGSSKSMNSIFVARCDKKAEISEQEIISNKKLIILSKKNALTKKIITIADKLNLPVTRINSSDDLENLELNDKHVIIDLRNYFHFDDKLNAKNLENIITDECLNTIQTLKAIDKINKKLNYIIITNNVTTVGGNEAPNIIQAPLRGIARTIFGEFTNINFKIIDISKKPSVIDLHNLLIEVISDSAEDEVALKNNNRYVPRLVVSPPKGSCNFTVRRDKNGKTKIAEYKKIDNQQFIKNVKNMPADLIKIKTEFAGVNFKDAAIVSNLLESSDSDTDFALGLEGSGVVASVGKNVKNVKPGDKVIYFTNNGFSNYSYCTEKLLMLKPDNISSAEGAILPTAFVTAYYALEKMARLKKNEKVLIHTATGGVGLAAIQIAKNIGAEIYCTAGSIQKRNFLSSLGVTCVGSSRDFQFADKVMEITRGEGVDVILNTLPSAFIKKNISVLKCTTGRIIDISNIHYDDIIKTSFFRKGVSFFSLNLTDMINNKPDIIKNLLDELHFKFKKNIYRPLPYRLFPIDELDDALNNISSAKHIGKYVVDVQDSKTIPIPTNEKLSVNQNGCYLIVGGTSGLGFAMAEWLADCGAKNIALVGRTKSKVKKIRDKINSMKALGVNVRIFYCDVSDFEQIKNVFDVVNKEMAIINGVVLSAMVLNDKSLLKMNKTDFEKVMKPKIAGAWNLHLLTKNSKLDFFICFSSFASLIGNRGQANYGAANSFLDALALYRKKLKLPALTLGLGMVSDTGFVAGNADVKKMLENIGVNSITKNQIFMAIVRLLKRGVPFIGFINIDWQQMAKKIDYVSSAPKFFQITKKTPNNQLNTLQARDETVSVSKNAVKAKTYLTEVIENLVAKSLGLQAVPTDLPLNSIGLDSLISVDLADKLQKKLNVQLSRMVLLQNGLTIQSLVEEVKKHLPDKLTVREEIIKKEVSDDKSSVSEKKAFEFPAEYIEMKKDAEKNEIATAYFLTSQGVNNNFTKINGKNFINFCSYNYLGLSGDKEVSNAVAQAVKKYGTSVSASRIASGERPLHRQLEKEIAGFIGSEDCLVFISGYETNESVIGNLMTKDDVIFYDSLIHSSIQQGGKLSGARVVSFPHNNFEALDSLMRSHRNNFKHALVVIEGVYSMDGDIPNLPQFIKIKNNNNAMLMVDEAHSIGVLGKTGRGISEFFKVKPDEVELWMGTLSKAFASAGGYIAAKKEMIEFLKFTTPGFVYSVGLSPSDTAAALASLRKLKSSPERVTRLQNNAELFLKLAKTKGANTGTAKGSAVVPIILGDSKKCLALHKKLYNNGVLALPVIYPAVPESAARIRFFISSAHTEEQIKFTCNLL